MAGVPSWDPGSILPDVIQIHSQKPSLPWENLQSKQTKGKRNTNFYTHFTEWKLRHRAITWHDQSHTKSLWQRQELNQDFLETELVSYQQNHPCFKHEELWDSFRLQSASSKETSNPSFRIWFAYQRACAVLLRTHVCSFQLQENVLGA